MRGGGVMYENRTQNYDPEIHEEYVIGSAS